MVEHAAVNRGVEGSSPSSGAILKAPIYVGFFKELLATVSETGLASIWCTGVEWMPTTSHPHSPHCGHMAWSYRLIATELNRLNVPTKTGAGNVITYKSAKRLSHVRWQCGNVHKVLCRRTTQDWLRQELAI